MSDNHGFHQLSLFIKAVKTLNDSYSSSSQISVIFYAILAVFFVFFFLHKPQTQRCGSTCQTDIQDALHNHQGMLLPSQSKRVPLSFSVRLVMTFIMPLTLSAVVRGACGPPISVWTHPGWRDATRMPSFLKSSAKQRVNMFSAALQMR